MINQETRYYKVSSKPTNLRAPLLIAFLPDFGVARRTRVMSVSRRGSVGQVSAILSYLCKLRFSKLVRLELEQKF